MSTPASDAVTQIDLPLNLPSARARIQEPIIRDAAIEDNYRWTMKRAWSAGRCIHWHLLNPSAADASRDDPTTLRMMNFSLGWGFGSMIVTNVYPFISANQAALHRWCRMWRWQEPVLGTWEIDKSALNAWMRNIDVVRGVIGQTDVHVAAWGAGAHPVDLEEFLDEVSFDFDANHGRGANVKIDWQCIGRNRDGSPVHPLARGRNRVPDGTELRAWQ